MSQSSQLVRLPRELLDNVTNSLPTKDFNALRLTCKELEVKTFPYWANCFFKKRQFMIDQFSLQTLVDISHHEALSKVLTHLIIGLDELKAFNIRSPQLQSLAEFHRWRAADCAQKALLFGGGAVHLLSQALANLPNLKTIDLRDFNSNTRFRDATPGKETPSWRSYGSSRYQQWPRESPWLLSPDSLTTFPDTVFIVVLNAVTQSSITLQNLEVVLRNRQSCLRDDAFSIFGAPNTPNTDALHGLTKLHLDLGSLGSFGSRLPALPTSQNDWCDPCTAYLRHFLALTPNLTWLRLNFHHNRHGGPSADSASKFISWLALKLDINAPADAPWGEANPTPVALPLQRLDLGCLTTSPNVLRGLLTKFVDLERISMREVWLQNPAATPVSHQHDGDTSGDCLWARFIRNFHVTNPKLKHIELCDIRQGASHGYDRIVFIRYNPTQVDHSTNTQIVDTKTLQQLADATWTDQRWYRAQHVDDGMDEDSLDDDSLVEVTTDQGESGDSEESDE